MLIDVPVPVIIIKPPGIINQSVSVVVIDCGIRTRSHRYRNCTGAGKTGCKSATDAGRIYWETIQTWYIQTGTSWAWSNRRKQGTYWKVHPPACRNCGLQIITKKENLFPPLMSATQFAGIEIGKRDRDKFMLQPFFYFKGNNVEYDSNNPWRTPFHTISKRRWLDYY